MYYAQITNGIATDLENALYSWDENNYCTPAALVNDGKAAQFGVVPVTFVSAPSHDPITQAAERDGCELVEGSWRHKWRIDALSAEQIAANQADYEARRISALWQAAHDYEYAQVSGSAIGLLAIGVLQGLPKCLAVQAWIKSIWTAYYERKFGTSTNTDFSIAGLCPHSVPELMVELGV